MKTDYDFIIAGAGASGLSLLWRIIHHPQLSQSSILLIDKALIWKSSKTWCFWNAPDELIAPFVDHTWDSIEVATDHGSFSKIEPHPYFQINSSNFRKKIFDHVRDLNSVTLLEADILSFEQGSPHHHPSIITSSGDFSAKHIFQSVYFGNSTRSNTTLQQVFKGFVVQTKKNVFDPRCITLMDFSTGAHFKGETAFFYVLPFSEKEALIESTLFTTQKVTSHAFDRSIHWYLSDKYGLAEGAYNIINSEQGMIPMDAAFTPPDLGEGIINIGSPSGATKPSTGYTFDRTQNHLQQILDALENGERPPEYHAGNLRFTFYDQLLTSILVDKPELGPSIFHQLFAHQPIEKVLKFLDENTTLIDETGIFSRLPWIPFLKAAFENIRNRFQ